MVSLNKTFLTKTDSYIKPLDTISKKNIIMPFPGGSKTRVNRAGESIRNGNPSNEDIEAVDKWRAAHRSVLNTFQAILRIRAKNKNVVVAQRHKRKLTIYDKLLRFPKMQLSRMDDVAGCRLIFNSVNELNEFREKVLKARFRHKIKNDINKYDYIANPKKTGYRGIHDIYSYDVNSVYGKELIGLLIEIQYRTHVQHSWATAVEIIGFITKNQPKFERGDKRYQYAMAYASEILSRAHEGLKGPFPELNNSEIVEKFLKLDKEINLLRTLQGINSTNTEISEKKNTILIFKESGDLEVRTFRDATDALRELFRLEKEIPHEDIVLVKADTSQDVRLAFKNYFSDARDFIDLVQRGCETLSGRSIVSI